MDGALEVDFVDCFGAVLGVGPVPEETALADGHFEGLVERLESENVQIQLMRWMFDDCWNGYFVGRDKTLYSILNTHVVPQNPSKSIEHGSSEVVFPTLSSRQPIVYSAPHFVRGLLLYRGIDCICHLFPMKRKSIRI